MQVMDLRTLSIDCTDAPVRYRVDRTGAPIAGLSVACKLGKHSLFVTGYRAVTREGELQVSCAARTADLDPGHCRLTAVRLDAERVELDEDWYSRALASPGFARYVHP